MLQLFDTFLVLALASACAMDLAVLKLFFRTGGVAPVKCCLTLFRSTVLRELRVGLRCPLLFGEPYIIYSLTGG